MPQLSGGPAAQAGAAPLPLVEARGLIKEYARHGGVTRVVDDVSFAIQPGETLGLVGESGCGKTTVARILLRLIEPTAGEVLFEGQPLPPASSAAMRALRRRMQIVFQDPYAALNPRMTRQPDSRRAIQQSTANRRRKACPRASPNCSARSAWTHRPCRAIRTSSAAASASASTSPAPSPCARASSSSTSRSARSTSRSARRSSTCCAICNARSASPISSSRTPCLWCDTYATASP